MYFDIVSAKYIENYKIELLFENGKKGIIDLIEYTGKNDVFAPFDSIEFFKNYKIEYGTLTWGDGELDIAPETLYEKATGIK